MYAVTDRFIVAKVAYLNPSQAGFDYRSRFNIFQRFKPINERSLSVSGQIIPNLNHGSSVAYVQHRVKGDGGTSKVYR